MTRRTTTLMLENAYCLGGSAQSLEHALRKVAGVRRAYVNPVTEAAYVEFDADQCTDVELIRVVESLGVTVGGRHSPAGAATISQRPGVTHDQGQSAGEEPTPVPNATSPTITRSQS